VSKVSLPNEWSARDYQTPFMTHMLSGGSMNKKRAVEVWHRRAGKDSCSLQVCAIASQMRVGTYWHMLPSLQQGRRVVWEARDKLGRRMINQAFPEGMRLGSPNESNMKIEFANGSVWQVVGSDNFDSLVGSNPIGIVFSEYSIADPDAWEYFRPILKENDGWAVFIYTPRGKTHGHTLYNIAVEEAKTNPFWHASKLTINDTGIMTDQDVEDEVRQGMSREKAMQEFYCSFDIGMEGAFYTEALAWAEKAGNIGDHPWNPDRPVDTWWDIGMRDNTSVIFTQQSMEGNPIVIDHQSRRNWGAPDWAKEINSLPYSYSSHNGPHDLEQREWGTTVTRQETAERHGLRFEIVPKIPVQDGIDAVRSIIRRAKWDRKATQSLRDNLAYYHREWDDKRQIFKDKPQHDHSSHDADAMRTLAVGWEQIKVGNILIKDVDGKYKPNITVKRAYNPTKVGRHYGR
jgi:phage terminase large subunit